MNLQMKKIIFYGFSLFHIPLLFLSSCNIQMNSIVDKNYNAKNKNILILMTYDAYNESTVEKFQKEFMLKAKNAKNNIQFFTIQQSDVKERLKLNEESVTEKHINATITESNIDIVIQMIPKKRIVTNGLDSYIRYLAIGHETIERKEIWKAQIETDSSLFGTAAMAKKMAMKFYNQLVSDGLISVE